MRNASFFISFLFTVLLTVAGYSVPPKCERFVPLYAGLVQEADYAWPSRMLKHTRVTDASRGFDIIMDVAVSKGRIQKELARYLDTLTPGELERIRQNIGDLFNVLEPGYQETLWTTDEALGATARVADLGCGSGMTCAYLAFDAPARTIVAVDNREVVMPTITRRVAVLPQPRGRVETMAVDFMALDFAPESLDGVVINFTLFHLPMATKVALVGRAVGWLKAGGKLFVNDPVLFDRGGDPTEMWYVTATEIVGSPFPITEFQFALWGALRGGEFGKRLGVDYKGDAEPLSQYRLERLLVDANLEIDQSEYVAAHGYARVIGVKK